MASSRRFPPDDIRAAVTRAIARDAAGADAIVVALSGGRDSVALLDAVCAHAAPGGVRVAAAHVHHGLSGEADRWARFCEELCHTRGIAFAATRVVVTPTRADGVEAAARDARYRALAAMAKAHGTDVVALAHHADDQAETLLLQLVRGAGPAGLAAMPARRMTAGITWLRPLIDVPRAAIDAYVAHHALAYVDDDSNASDRHKRNALRHAVVPALARLAPGYPRTLVRAAALQAEAATLADELAAVDANGACDPHARARGARRARAASCAQPAALVPAPARNAAAVGRAPSRNARAARARPAGCCGRLAPRRLRDRRARGAHRRQPACRGTARVARVAAQGVPLRFTAGAARHAKRARVSPWRRCTFSSGHSSRRSSH